MKQLLFLLFIFSFFASCNQSKPDKTQSKLEHKKELETIQSKKKKDTINNYWAINLDTIISHQKFIIHSLKHTLELKTYSLNDSSIVRNLSQDKEQVYLDHSHKMVTDFKLRTDTIIDKKQIDLTDFKKTLISEFYTKCNLFSTDIDSLSLDTIYLTSDLAIPDTDNQWRVWYSVKIKGKQLGKLEFIKTKYVGI